VQRRVAAGLPVEAPGLRTAYGDVNFIVLGDVGRRVSGLPLDVHAQRRILEVPSAANRDDLGTGGAVGHTGYTGTGLWVDHEQSRFVVILSNRVHLGEQGDARPLRRQLPALLSGLAPPRPGVSTGRDFLRAQGSATQAL
jgi:CubicO group peptidase (beta-lactamase class C family)